LASVSSVADVSAEMVSVVCSISRRIAFITASSFHRHCARADGTILIGSTSTLHPSVPKAMLGFADGHLLIRWVLLSFVALRLRKCLSAASQADSVGTADSPRLFLMTPQRPHHGRYGRRIAFGAFLWFRRLIWRLTIKTLGVQITGAPQCAE
jgi:hypothetical protein